MFDYRYHALSLAAVLLALAVVWTTPALRDVVDLLWLKLQLMGDIRAVAAPV